jgi:predicted RNase H-like nuclease (RuvC/YqgF family)
MNLEIESYEGELSQLRSTVIELQKEVSFLQHELNLIKNRNYNEKTVESDRYW